MRAPQIAFVSIAVNLVLAVIVAVVLKSPPPQLVVVETNAPARVVERRVEVPEAFDWRRVESDDYRQYVANLRSIGCPEQTVRDIIIADVNALFEARRQAALSESDDFKYWQPGRIHLFGTAQGQRLQRQFEQLRELAEEKRAVLRELLGIDVIDRPAAALATLNPREQMLAFLPAEKRLKIEEIERRHGARLMEKVVDETGAEQLGNYRRIQAEKRAEVQALLSPEEFEEYEMRLSPAAVAVRAGLGRVDLTPDEFRTLVNFRKAFDEETGDFLIHDPLDPQAGERKATAEKRLEARMRELLGPERWAAYRGQKEQSLRSAGIGPEAQPVPELLAVSVQEIKTIALGEFQRLQGDPSLPAEIRQGTLAEVYGAVEEAMIQVLGRPGYETYLAHPAAGWLRKLKPVAAVGPVGGP